MPNYSAITEPSTGCLDIAVTLRDAAPRARYTVGLSVYGADLPAAGRLRASLRPDRAPVGDGAAPGVKEYRLGTVRTDERGKARYQRTVAVAPGRYEAQVWVDGPAGAPGARPEGRQALGDVRGLVVEDGPDTGRYLRMRGHPRPVRGARRVVSSGSESLIAGRDLRRLRTVLPELDDYPALAAESRRELEPYRREYVANVSNDVMAASLELAVFLRVLCHIRRPQRIVDLGSGFSSFVLRRYMAETTPAPVVWSVDDSADWLERTREYLGRHDLPVGNMATWPDFAAQAPGDFDLVLHDLGAPPVRTAALPKVLRLARADGLVVIDDMHKTWYRPYARRIVRESGGQYFSVRSLTLDNFGRYAAVATR